MTANDENEVVPAGQVYCCNLSFAGGPAYRVDQADLLEPVQSVVHYAGGESGEVLMALRGLGKYADVLRYLVDVGQYLPIYAGDAVAAGPAQHALYLGVVRVPEYDHIKAMAGHLSCHTLCMADPGASGIYRLQLAVLN